MIIPFFIPHAGCPHQCVFCDQRRIAGTETAPAPLDIAPAIERYLATDRSSRPADVAFFGGTFTALPADHQQAYLLAVQPFIEAGTVRSIRVSTRPDAVCSDGLALLKRNSVTLVELGVQSLNDTVLQRSGRGHQAEDTVRAAALLRDHGFLVGFQLMPGLPGDSIETFRETVRQTVSLGPDMVRIYPSLVIEGTPLADQYHAGAYAPLTLSDAVTWCAEALDSFDEAGIEVVRVGLQPTDVLERPGTIVAGPYHPAFRQVVETERFLQRMLNASGPGGPAIFLVNPRDLSLAIGQRRTNLSSLRRQLGRGTRILSDAAVPRGTVVVKKTCPSPQDAL